MNVLSGFAAMHFWPPKPPLIYNHIETNFNSYNTIVFMFTFMFIQITNRQH